MRIADIKKLCSESKTIRVVTGLSGGCYMGNAFALYLMPRLQIRDADMALLVCDIPEKDRQKWDVKFEDIRTGAAGALCWNDSVPDEFQIEFKPLRIVMMDEYCITMAPAPLLVPRRYITPVFKDAESITFWLRSTPGGTHYIAIKDGPFLVALIFPECINPVQKERLGSLAEVIDWICNEHEA